MLVRVLRKHSREDGNRKTAGPKTHDPAGRGNEKKAMSLCFVKFWCSCLFGKTIEDIQHKYSVNYAVRTWNGNTAIQMPTQPSRGSVVEIKHHTWPAWTVAGAKTSGHHAKASRCASNEREVIHNRRKKSFSSFVSRIQLIFSPQVQI